MSSSPEGRFPSLRDRSVLVTGGASGIGAAIVEAFVRQGSRVAFLDVDEPAAAATIARLAAGPHAPLFLRCDLRAAETIPATVETVAKEIGPIRVLVNNAAHDERHGIDELTPENWRERMAINLDHQFFCTQAVISGMAEAGGGAVINLGSCSWHLGLGGMPAYVTAKAAIEGLTRGLARDLGPRHIRVNCIVPGFIRTERQVAKWLTPELERTVLDGQCLKELIGPEAVAAMALFLASDDGRFCTSQTYAVDGGWM